LCYLRGQMGEERERPRQVRQTRVVGHKLGGKSGQNGIYLAASGGKRKWDRPRSKGKVGTWRNVLQKRKKGNQTAILGKDASRKREWSRGKVTAGRGV